MFQRHAILTCRAVHAQLGSATSQTTDGNVAFSCKPRELTNLQLTYVEVMTSNDLRIFESFIIMSWSCCIRTDQDVCLWNACKVGQWVLQPNCTATVNLRSTMEV